MKNIKMTEMQKAYYVGREDVTNGATGTHLYIEVLFAGSADSLENALNKVISAQPFLRAHIGNNLDFIIEDSLRYQIKVIDGDAFDDKIISNIRDRLSHKIYSEKDFPLFTVELLGRNDYYRIFLSIDMLIADGLSLFELCREIKHYINNPTDAPENRMEDLLYISAYYHEQRLSNRYFRSRDYYLKKLDKIYPAPALSYLDGIADGKFLHLEKTLSAEAYSALCLRAQKEELTATDVLFTAYAMVLAKWSRSAAMSINMTTFQRPQDEKYLSVIGDFTTSMLVQAQVSWDKSFVENAKKMKKAMFVSYKHCFFEVPELIRELTRVNPGITMPVVFTSMLFDGVRLWDADFQYDYCISQTSQVNLDSQVKLLENKLNITWDYRKGMIRSKQIEEMFAEYLAIVESFIAGTEDVLVEYRQGFTSSMCELYASYNAISSPEYLPLPCGLKELFEQTVLKHRDKTFVSVDGEAYSFGWVYDKASTLVERIKAKKQYCGKKKTRIAFVGSKMIDSFVKIISAVLGGDSFCVINEDYGKDKRNETLSKLGNYILIDGDSIICSDDNTPINEKESYVLFTSGTTGTPKGIIISESAALNTVNAINKMFAVSATDVILNISNLYFDLSVFDIFSSMITGAEIVSVNPLFWSSVGDRYSNRITIWNSTPALANEFATKKRLDHIRLFLMSGDFVAINLVDKLFSMYSEDVSVIALGGATEASIWSNYFDCRQPHLGRTIPYGHPLFEQELYIINTYSGMLCPENVPGEICISGAGLAEGYLEAEQTAQAFVLDTQVGKRIYRTGDLGFLSDDGNIYITGRIAQEIKHNGYRIDLREIEKYITSMDCISNALVVVERLSEFRTRLSAVVESPNRFVDTEIRTFLSEKLPHYMIPSNILVVKKFPLTNNGKIDTAELRRWLGEAKENTEEFSEAEKEMLAIWKQTIPDDGYIEITHHNATYFDAGGQSLQAVELMNAIEQHYCLKISLHDLINNISLRDMTALVQSSLTFPMVTDRASAGNTSGDASNTEDIHSIFDRQGMLYDHSHSYDKNAFADPTYVDSFRRSSISRIVFSADQTDVILAPAKSVSYYEKRHSIRRFDNTEMVAFECLCELLGVLRQKNERYLYPSAGGLYPIDCYIYVKKNRVENVEEGIYYYNPKTNSLHKINGKQIDISAHFFTNRDIFASSAFSLFLVYNSSASMPKYGGMAYYYAIIEAGIISELLSIQADRLGLGSCIIGEIDILSINSQLALDDDDKYLLTIEFGAEKKTDDFQCCGDLVLLRKGSADKNLVLVHAGSGEINAYLALANYIDEQYNVYAIKRKHNMAKLAPGEYRFDLIAKEYDALTDQLTHVDVIGGWCVGGTIAYEMSLLNPQKYTKLLMINSMAPVSDIRHDVEFDMQSELDLVSGLGLMNGYDRGTDSIEALWRSVADKIKSNVLLRKLMMKMIPQKLMRLLPAPDKLPVEEIIYYINHFRSSNMARATYPGNGVSKIRTIYLTASREPIDGYQNWEKFLPNIDYLEIKGDHVSIFDEKNVLSWITEVNNRLL